MLKIEFPHRLQHFANTTGISWKARAGHARRLRHAVAWNLLPIRERPSLPCKVTITRLAPHKFDSDNLVHACKPIRDEVAAWIGVNDRHDRLVKYVCEQQATKAGEYFVRIEIEPMNEPEDETA